MLANLPVKRPQKKEAQGRGENSRPGRALSLRFLLVTAQRVDYAQ